MARSQPRSLTSRQLETAKRKKRGREKKRKPQHRLPHLQRVLEYFLRAHVYLGDHNKHGDVESQGQAKMLFSHADDASISTHHQHAEVRSVSRHAEHGGLQVALVTGQVNECDDLNSHRSHGIKKPKWRKQTNTHARARTHAHTETEARHRMLVQRSSIAPASTGEGHTHRASIRKERLDQTSRVCPNKQYHTGLDESCQQAHCNALPKSYSMI